MDPSGILPVTHVSQMSCWIPAALPASHVAHAAPLLYVPTPQASHAFLSVLGTCPDPHKVQIVAFDAVETSPAPQVLHSVMAVGRVNASRYFPGAQSRQAERPAAVVYCPASHVGQTSTPMADAVPCAHGSHVLSAVPVCIVRYSPEPHWVHVALTVSGIQPGSQRVQAVAPGVIELTWLPGQSVQTGSPSVPANFPNGQSSHAARVPDAVKRPIGQFAQSVADVIFSPATQLLLSEIAVTQDA